ncbi:helix-turn-helix domain-containing protein [Pontibacter sp. H259]|uniref:helix-turn-helix transcriptional regulator n=1 Tax=Pontibacter sp. H259 TaxID=3133421 RepID=UPI0030BD9A8A
MNTNPFDSIESRLTRLEALLLELRAASTPAVVTPQDRCSLSEAVALTGLSKSKLYKLTAAGQVPHKRFGNRLVFSRAALAAWVDAQTVEKNRQRAACLMLANSARNKKGGFHG